MPRDLTLCLFVAAPSPAKQSPVRFSPEENGDEEDVKASAADSWEDHSGSGSPTATPDDDEGGSDSAVATSKPRMKQKPKTEEATMTEKEHVNVVFIGHVGKCFLPILCLLSCPVRQPFFTQKNQVLNTS